MMTRLTSVLVRNQAEALRFYAGVLGFPILWEEMLVSRAGHLDSHSHFTGSASAAMTYSVVVYPTDEGYAVYCPMLPGCVSQGDTQQDALENIRSAISEYLSCLRDTLAPCRVT